MLALFSIVNIVAFLKPFLLLFTKETISPFFHCSFIERYRHEDSWQGVRNLSALGAKICLLTATTNATATKMIAHYCGIGDNYILVGGPTQYALPNVGFEVRQTRNELLLSEIVTHISQRLHPPNVMVSTAIHVITVSREEAETLSRMINQAGIKADWLTSKGCRFLCQNRPFSVHHPCQNRPFSVHHPCQNRPFSVLRPCQNRPFLSQPFCTMY